jgi:hypothetical protein
MIEDQKKDPVYGVFAEQTGFAESLPLYDYERYKQIFSQAITNVLATTSPADAMRAAASQIDALLPSSGLIPPAPKPATTQQGSQ